MTAEPIGTEPAVLAETRQLSLASKAGYGAGQVAGQVFRDVPSLLLLFFMTSVLGVNAALAGTAIFLPKLIGGIVFDVLVGVLSDRWRHRFARWNWLLVGAVAAPVAIILLFHVPVTDPDQAALYIAFAFSLYMAVFACLSVPYLAITGDLELSPRQRTVLMAWRLAFTAIGVLIAGAIAPAFVAAMGGGRAGYEAMSLMLAAICFVSLVIGWFGSRKAAGEVGSQPATLDRLTLRASLIALRDDRFSVLAVVTLLQLVAAGMAYAGLLYFISYNLAVPDALSRVGLVVLLACAGIMLAQPMWVKLVDRWGKKRAYVVASLIHALAHLGWATSWWGGLELLYASAFVLGIGNSGWAMVGFSLVGDIGGEGKAGLYSSVYIALDKIAFALGGALLIGIVLDAFGFDSVAASQGGAQPDSALIGIWLAFGVIPAVCNIIGALIFAIRGRV